MEIAQDDLIATFLNLESFDDSTSTSSFPSSPGYELSSPTQYGYPDQALQNFTSSGESDDCPSPSQLIEGKDFTNFTPTIQHFKTEHFEECLSPSTKKRKIISNSSIPLVPNIAPHPATKQIVNNDQYKNSGMSDEYIKRQQRLIKNREAASISRQKRKNHVQSLETKINFLQKENDDLKKKVDLLEQRNHELSSKLQLGLKGTMKAASVVVLVVFFSFAIFLHPISTPENFESSLMPADSNRISFQKSRTLQSTQKFEQISDHSSTPSTSSDSSASPTTTSSSPSSFSSPSPNDSHPNSHSHSNSHSNTYFLERIQYNESFGESHTAVETSDLQYWLDRSLENQHNPERGLSLHQNHHEQDFFERKPNVAYVFCSDVFQILPNEKTQNGKPRISLIVPSHSWEQNQEIDSFVQVDCEVLSTHIFSLNNSEPKVKEENVTLSEL